MENEKSCCCTRTQDFCFKGCACWHHERAKLTEKIEGMKLNERKTAKWEFDGMVFGVNSFEEKMTYNAALDDVLAHLQEDTKSD